MRRLILLFSLVLATAAAPALGFEGKPKLGPDAIALYVSLRQGKRRDELTKQIAALKGRLANESYTAKAPPHLVQQTRDQLSAAEEELSKLG